MKTLVAIFFLFVAISSKGAFVPGVMTTNLPSAQQTFAYTNQFLTVSSISGSTPNNGANFGPDTPGTTTCGIQEALKALTNIPTVLGGGGIVLGKGVFQCSGQIVIPNSNDFNVVFQGCGQTATAIVYTNTTVQDFMVCASNFDGGEPARNLSLVMRDLGVYYLTDTNKSVICHFANVHDALIQNCRFGSYNAMFVNGVASANFVDAYPTNTIGIIPIRFDNQQLNNAVVLENCFVAGVASGVELGSDHNRVKNLFVANCGRFWLNGVTKTDGNRWTTILTNKVVILATANDFVTINNMRTGGAALIGDAGLYECQVDGIETYVCKAAIMTHGVATGPNISVFGYNEFESTSYRVLGTVPGNGSGIQNVGTLTPVQFLNFQNLHGSQNGDYFISLTNGTLYVDDGSTYPSTADNRASFDYTFNVGAGIAFQAGPLLDFPPRFAFGDGTSSSGTAGGRKMALGLNGDLQVGFTGNPADLGTASLNNDGSLRAASGAAGISLSGVYTGPQYVVSGTTNQVVFGSTNNAPTNASTITKWISVQVNGEATKYRVPLYQ